MTVRADWEQVAPSVWRRRGQGPALALVGSIHGDEAHGAQVIREWVAAGLPSSGAIDPDVILAIGNPDALELDQRGTVAGADLNRMFTVEPGSGETAEHQRCGELRGALEGVQRLLDLHQTSCETPPLAVGPATDAHVNETARLGLGILVSGVEAIYGGGMLSEWVDRRGGIGLAVETGRKGTQASLHVARDVAQRFLAGVPHEPTGPVRVYEIQEPLFAPAPGLRFVRALGNTTPVMAGEVLGTTDGSPLRAPGDGAIFLPREIQDTKRPCLLFARDLGFREPNGP